MIRAVLVLAVAMLAQMSALDLGDWGVDEPSRWYDPSVSHHLQHGAGGFGVGAVAWGGAWLCGANRFTRVTASVGSGVVVGIGFEYYQAKRVQAMIDPVDALRVVGGSALAAGLGELGLVAVEIIITPDVVAFGYTWSY